MHDLFLTDSALFRGMTAAQAREMLSCLGSFERRYEKSVVILRAGDGTDYMGVVLSGGVNIEIDDLWGNKTILGHVGASQLFAETYACIPGEPLMVSAVAAERCEILFLNAARLLSPCTNNCAYHSRLIRNLLEITANKNLLLSRRSVHTSSKTIRGRLLSYLSEQAKQSGSLGFTVPFNRQQLADYLGVDRSALSNELSKMQRDGLLSYHKNRFSLKEHGASERGEANE